MAADPLSVSTAIAAAAGMLVLAVMLVLLRFSSGANRAFALFLVLQGAAIMAVTLWRLTGEADARMQAVWFDLTAYFLLAIPAVVVYFFIAYTGRPQRNRRIWGWSLLLATLALEAMYLLDHCTVLCHTDGPQTAWTLSAGPLYVIEYGFPLAVALVGLALVLRVRGQPPSAARSCTSLVGVTLALSTLVDVVLQAYALFDPALRGRTASGYSDRLWLDIASWTRLAAGIPVLLTLAIWARTHKEGAAHRASLTAAAVVAVGAAIAIGGIFADAQADQRGWETTTGTILVGAWRLVTPALVAYGLLRHRLFELDPILKRTIGPTTIASVFLAVFFVASKIIENLMGNTYGAIGGGIAAGLLLFALSPLERMGSRISNTIVPRGRPIPSMEPDELRQLYRDQASLVWSDGVMRPPERAMLDGLRTRFGLTAETAAALEREAMDLVPARLPPRPQTARRAARRARP